MTDIPPPEQPGWYADASGAWWWWDGTGWTPQLAPSVWGSGAPADPLAADRSQERTMAMVMWIVYLVGGGFIGALVFYFVSREKLFTRHHSAEALNLTIVLLIPQILGVVLAAPAYIDLVTTMDDANATVDLSGGFWLGLALLVASSLLSYGLAIAGAVQAHRGRWWRLPIGLHPVRGSVRKGQEPYAVT